VRVLDLVACMEEEGRGHEVVAFAGVAEEGEEDTVEGAHVELVVGQGGKVESGWAG